MKGPQGLRGNTHVSAGHTDLGRDVFLESERTLTTRGKATVCAGPADAPRRREGEQPDTFLGAQRPGTGADTGGLTAAQAGTKALGCSSPFRGNLPEHAKRSTVRAAGKEQPCTRRPPRVPRLLSPGWPHGPWASRWGSLPPTTGATAPPSGTQQTPPAPGTTFLPRPPHASLPPLG